MIQYMPASSDAGARRLPLAARAAAAGKRGQRLSGGGAAECGYDQLVEKLSKLPADVPVAIVVQSVYERFSSRLRNAGFNIVRN